MYRNLCAQQTIERVVCCALCFLFFIIATIPAAINATDESMSLLIKLAKKLQQQNNIQL